MVLFRLIFLPLKLAAAFVALALRFGLWLGALPFRATGRAARLVGLKGTVLFGAGAAAGALLSPASGPDLRRKLLAGVSGGAPGGGDDDLAEKVRFELAHAPRTWHLPQPTVTVAAGRVVLSGDVPHDEGREELGRVAGAVPGVSAVENRLVVAPTLEDVEAELTEALIEEGVDAEIAEELAEELIDELIVEAVAEELAEELVEEAIEEAIVEAVAEELVEELVEEAIEEAVVEAVADAVAEELVAEGVPAEVAEEVAAEVAEELREELAAEEEGD